ncbi:MAG: pantoate--beta-alanine ligase, partial [Nocardioidaceae bacterium]
SRALLAGAAVAGRGGSAVLVAAGAVLGEVDAVETDYLELTAPDLGPVPESGEARLLVAARVGTTRLIDNTALTLGGQAGSI